MSKYILTDDRGETYSIDSGLPLKDAAKRYSNKTFPFFAEEGEEEKITKGPIKIVSVTKGE